jgi:hypothetical protein
MVKKYRPESTRQTTQKGPKNTSKPVSAQSVKSDKSPSNYKASNANDTRKRTNSQVAPVKDENSNSVWGKLPKKQ